MLALDHRGSFNKLINSKKPEDATIEEVIEVKKQIIRSLFDQFSGVLIDPDGGLPALQQIIREEGRPKPFLLCIEKTGYEDEQGARKTTLQYSVSQLHQMGASGIKLLLYYHPQAPTLKHQLHVAKEVLDSCRNAGLPLFLELVTYTLPSYNSHKPELVLDSVNQFLEAGIIPDVFKLEYPGDPAACFEITRILGKTPWILLTKGNDFNKFKMDLKVAVSNGAKGFLAGRSVWQEFANLPKNEQNQFFQTTVTSRFEEIVRTVLGT